MRYHRLLLLVLAMGLMASWSFAQEGKNIRELGSIPGSILGTEVSWSDWTFNSADQTGSATIQPTGGVHGGPAVEIIYSGEGQWSYKSPLINLSEEAFALSALAWGQVSEGTLHANIAIFRDKSGQRNGRTVGSFYAEEGDHWSQILAVVPATKGYNNFQIIFSGQGKTKAHLGTTTITSGEPLAKEDWPKLTGYAKELKEEKLDRRVIATACPEGAYVSWRLLKSDPNKVGFNIYRRTGSTGNFEQLNKTPIVQTSDFLDKTAQNGTDYTWRVKAVVQGKETNETAEYSLAIPKTNEEKKNYVSIKLQGDYDVSRVAFADLNGDGKLDYVVKQPNKNVDPYHMPNYWKKSEGTFGFEAYDSSGKFLWKHDLGWAIEQGIWYSPMIVYDLDGDGKAEVIAKTGKGDPRDAAGRVHSQEEFLTVFEGATGQVITEVPWPSGVGFSYNYACRNFLLIAYLDGKTPFLIAHRGTYSLMRMTAWQLVDGKLEEKLTWSNTYDLPLWGQGAHRSHAIDIDGDGREEMIIGSFVLDDDGSTLWQLGLGHPDHMYVGDLNPESPGLEIYYGIESRNDKNGMCMVEAKTGKYLWGFDGKTWHIHANGICADLDPQFPGAECFGGESKNENSSDRFLWTAAGKLLARGESEKDVLLPSLGAPTAYWDDTPQQVILRGSSRGTMMKLNFPKIDSLPDTYQGSVVTTTDVFGDWREEIVTSVNGELRIYTTTRPAKDRRECLLQDRNYRATTVENTVGYWLGPRLSYDMMTTPADK